MTATSIQVEVKERPISVITGKPSQRGHRLRSKDSLSWRDRNREAVNRRKRELYALNPERGRERSKTNRQKNYKQVLEANRRWRAVFWPQLRQECLVAYGERCVCCGESEPHFLELDHIYNDGASERRRHKNGQQELLSLKRAGWPRDRHQLLCANCNRGKLRNGGTCPHQTRNQ